MSTALETRGPATETPSSEDRLEDGLEVRTARGRRERRRRDRGAPTRRRPRSASHRQEWPPHQGDERLLAVMLELLVPSRPTDPERQGLQALTAVDRICDM